MQIKVSTKGQVVLPSPIRHTLGLRPGDPLDAKVEGGRIPRRQMRKIKSDSFEARQRVRSTGMAL